MGSILNLTEFGIDIHAFSPHFPTGLHEPCPAALSGNSHIHLFQRLTDVLGPGNVHLPGKRVNVMQQFIWQS
jgi:hypothetical protein